jgi:hypothetical protein
MFALLNKLNVHLQGPVNVSSTCIKKSYNYKLNRIYISEFGVNKILMFHIMALALKNKTASPVNESLLSEIEYHLFMNNSIFWDIRL